MKIYLSIFLLFSTTLLFSQKEMIVKSEWSVVQDEENTFTISKRLVDINDKKNGIFKAYYQYKFENKKEIQLFLNWNFITQYKNFSSGNLPTNENYRALLLKPGEVFIPDFLETKDKAFFVFKEFLNRPTKVTLESVTFHELKFKTL